MKKYKRFKNHLIIFTFNLFLLFVACKKESPFESPIKVTAGPDMELVAPTGPIELDARETLRQNLSSGDYNKVNVVWEIIHQPTGSGVVSLSRTSPPYFNEGSTKCIVKGLYEGLYSFRIGVRIESGPYTYDTMQIRVKPDTLKGSVKLYNDMVWKIGGWSDGWDEFIYATIYFEDSSLFGHRDTTNLEVLIWDDAKNNWKSPEQYFWYNFNSTIYIHSLEENNLLNLVGKSTRVQVKFL